MDDDSSSDLESVATSDLTVDLTNQPTGPINNVVGTAPQLLTDKVPATDLQTTIDNLVGISNGVSHSAKVLIVIHMYQ